ncbi:MAG: SGNH/GDSL hydrolase family protein [Nostoc sp. DedQUE12b]|uniref:SGNH/GDSL hydrolase family protein n=1 Tax=Nostoc sp. DedQUE12b TaxID=3075398 RepID=UPI002AD43291|nr:SGNH/GDSL hydrolase family protein [Nostoc sp. DedQUE12b]MDZ8086476.1 SGNH/GDSL hydrolase family protein [Nostoc sp. DedQUE12b]
MKKTILTTGFFLLSFMFPLQILAAQNYEDIYVFGDSFSDTGNAFNATNRTFPPSPKYFDGRFSNGPVWVEYLAQDFGLSFNPRTNFAFGGATTGVDNISVPEFPGLQRQIASFTAENPSANPNALYIVWAGANDYFSYFAGGVPNPNQAVANISAAVTSLAAIGAQDIMVVNQPDLGKFPVANFNSQIPSLFSTLTNAHNSGLNATINFLNQQLDPDVNIISFNVNDLFRRIIAEPKEFGLTNAINYCIQDLSVVPLNLPTQPVACNPDEFLFWDPVHPTAAAHRLIGESAFSVLKPVSVPEPSNGLGVLALSAFGAVSALQRRYQLMQNKAI